VKESFEEIFQKDLRVNQEGVVLSGFHEKGPRQVQLFENAEKLERIARIQETLDSLRKRFGGGSMRYGAALTQNINAHYIPHCPS
jgi:hypothetical protein